MILLDTHVLIWWANGDRKRLSALLASHTAVRLLALRQANPAERLTPETPIDIKVAVQRQDLGDLQPL